MQKDVASAKASCRFDRHAADHRTSAGSKETDEKELAVIPRGPRDVCVVTSVTPVPNWPNARRKSSVLVVSGVKLGKSVSIAASGAMHRSDCPELRAARCCLVVQRPRAYRDLARLCRMQTPHCNPWAKGAARSHLYRATAGAVGTSIGIGRWSGPGSAAVIQFFVYCLNGVEAEFYRTGFPWPKTQKISPLRVSYTMMRC